MDMCPKRQCQRSISFSGSDRLQLAPSVDAGERGSLASVFASPLNATAWNAVLPFVGSLFMSWSGPRGRSLDMPMVIDG